MESYHSFSPSFPLVSPSMAVNITIAQETELQTRNRIVSNVFKERHNCIILRIDTHVNDEKGINPFGFHFEMDRAKYEENKERMQRKAITRWLALAAIINHRLGLRHILLILLLSIYGAAGGLIFEALEADNEMENLDRTIDDMDDLMVDFVDTVVNITLNSQNETIRNSRLLHKTKVFYKEMLKTEDRYVGSAWHKAENLDLHLQWNTASAMFYAYTVFTTLGYGTIVCQTWEGRWITIVYAAFGIPLMLLTIGDLGELIQRRLCMVLDWTVDKIRMLRSKDDDIDSNISEKGTISEDEYDDDDYEDRRLPIWISCSLLGIYIVAVSFGIYLFDSGEYGEEGIDLQSSFYFTIISVTTVGFGDIMPASAQYNTLCSLSFVFGLTLISIINSSVYSQLYDAFYTGITAIEGTLDAIHEEIYMRPGHRIFKNMAPAFSTLILSFPSTKHAQLNRRPNIIFTQPSLRRDTDSSTDTIDIYERSFSTNIPPKKPFRNKNILRVQSACIRPRAPTLLPSPGTPEFNHNIEKHRSRIRAPTLGPFGGVDMARIKRKESIAKNRKRGKSLSPIRYRLSIDSE